MVGIPQVRRDRRSFHRRLGRRVRRRPDQDRAPHGAKESPSTINSLGSKRRSAPKPSMVGRKCFPVDSRGFFGLQSDKTIRVPKRGTATEELKDLLTIVRVLHWLITIGLIGTVMLQPSRSAGLGIVGGGGESPAMRKNWDGSFLRQSHRVPRGRPLL